MTLCETINIESWKYLPNSIKYKDFCKECECTNICLQGKYLKGVFNK